MAQSTHALKNKWLVSFLPFFSADVVDAEFGGNWQIASAEKMQELDWVTSVEEVWSTMNSLPRVQHMGRGSTFIVAREGKEPSFEVFPDGSRLIINLLKSPDMGLETIIAVVLGETLPTKEGTDDAVCDIIRFSSRQKGTTEILRVEVWLNDKDYATVVSNKLQEAMRERGIANHMYNIVESSFSSEQQQQHKPGSPKEAAASSPTMAAPEDSELGSPTDANNTADPQPQPEPEGGDEGEVAGKSPEPDDGDGAADREAEAGDTEAEAAGGEEKTTTE